MLGDLGGSGGSVRLKGAEGKAVATITIYPTLLHQVKMRMCGGWPLYAQQKQLTRKGVQFEKIIAELEGLDQRDLTGYRAEVTIRGNLSIEAAQRITSQILPSPLPRGTDNYREITPEQYLECLHCIFWEQLGMRHHIGQAT